MKRVSESPYIVYDNLVPYLSARANAELPMTISGGVALGEAGPLARAVGARRLLGALAAPIGTALGRQ